MLGMKMRVHKKTLEVAYELNLEWEIRETGERSSCSHN